eukprot:Hpha_TRINITY_DN33597_c0_g1::TRINITY_DN33597_c0_g1_i1::g.171043::m.171043
MRAAVRAFCSRGVGARPVCVQHRGFQRSVPRLEGYEQGSQRGKRSDDWDDDYEERKREPPRPRRRRDDDWDEDRGYSSRRRDDDYDDRREDRREGRRDDRSDDRRREGRRRDDYSDRRRDERQGEERREFRRDRGERRDTQEAPSSRNADPPSSRGPPSTSGEPARPLDPEIGSDRDFGPPKKFRDYTEERRDPAPPPAPRSRRLPQENEGVVDIVHGDGTRKLEIPEYKMWTAREGHVRRILKARYGSHPGEMRDPSGAHRIWDAKWSDVTPRIINQIRLDGSACFQVLNDLMGGDANPGAEKVLEIIYVPGRPGVKFEQVHMRDKSLGHWAEDDLPPERF